MFSRFIWAIAFDAVHFQFHFSFYFLFIFLRAWNAPFDVQMCLFVSDLRDFGALK